MPRLTWDNVGERFYETGVDRGVLYVGSDAGVAWTGLISVTQTPSIGTAKEYYLDAVKYVNLAPSEEFAATIDAYTYPNEFGQCDGTASAYTGLFITQQPRKPFGLSYRTLIGNDADGESAYKIHIVYNATAFPSEKVFKSLSGSSDPTEFSWDITTRPPAMPGYKPTAHIEIDTRTASSGSVSDIEDILYGTDITPSRIPTLAELIDVFNDNQPFVVIDLGDGSYTVLGPADMITMLDADTFEITSPSAIFIDADSYTLSSI